MIAATPASSKDLAKSMTIIGFFGRWLQLCHRAHQCHRYMPGEARGLAHQIGFSTATVPKITRCNPLFSQFSIVAISRIPPPIVRAPGIRTKSLRQGRRSRVRLQTRRLSHRMQPFTSHPAIPALRRVIKDSQICPYPHAKGARHCHLLGQLGYRSWGYLILCVATLLRGALKNAT